MTQKIEISGITTELLAIDEIMVLNNAQRTVSTWLLDTFFPRRMTFQSSHVPVAELGLDNPVAPYVSPCVEGRPLRRNGSANVQFVEAAYLKAKDVIEPCTSYDSALLGRLRQLSGGGSFNGGNLTYGESLVVDQLQKEQRLRTAIDNRRLLMAAEVLTTGKLMIASDDQPVREVDFGRDPSANYSPAITWDLPSSTPVQDIISMYQLATELSGTAPTIALTTSKVWGALRKHNDFNDSFVTPTRYDQTGTQTSAFGVLSNPLEPKMMGYMDGIQIWVFDAGIKLNDGTFKRFLPEDYFGLIGDANGVLAQCKIAAIEARGSSDEYFLKQWLNPEPSLLYIMAESAPLLIPSNVNANIGGTGFVA
jgi:hypothetical protein